MTINEREGVWFLIMIGCIVVRILLWASDIFEKDKK